MGKIQIKQQNDEDINNLVNALSRIEQKEILKAFIGHLKYEHELTSERIGELFGKKISVKILLPVSIFNNEELGILEAIVKYLKEELNLRFHDIALLLNRNDRTIWATYNIACKKRKDKLSVKESKISIPVSIFKDRKLSALEALVSYLKDNFNLRYSEISRLLRRDERNVWTVYNRAMKK